MTRINCVPVRELCDEHLRAEWRELTRIPNKLRNGKLKYQPYKIPMACPYADDETNEKATGHEYFFTDKLKWLYERYQEIVKECQRRGFDCEDRWPNFTFPEYQWNDWEPTDDDIARNRKRIKQRTPIPFHFNGLRYEG